MAIADVNDVVPSRRDLIVDRMVERVVNILGMQGASADKPYVNLSSDKLPFTWVVDVDESYDVGQSTEHYLATLEFVTWTAFHFEPEHETCRKVGRRILKALLIAIPAIETDPTLGVDHNGAPLVFRIWPIGSVIDPSGEPGAQGIVKARWGVEYLFLRTDPSEQ